MGFIRGDKICRLLNGRVENLQIRKFLGLLIGDEFRELVFGICFVDLGLGFFVDLREFAQMVEDASEGNGCCVTSSEAETGHVCKPL